MDKKQARALAAANKAGVKAQRPWVARHKILTLLGVFIVIGVISSIATSGGSKSDTAGDSGTSTVSKAADAPGGPGLNASARDGKFEFTVTKVESGVHSVGGEVLGQKAQGQFILLTVTVKNIGDKAQLFDASSQKLHDSSKRTYDADSGASIYANTSGSPTFLKNINPGNEVAGIVVFDVPSTVVPTQAELHDSPFSNGVKVRLS